MLLRTLELPEKDVVCKISVKKFSITQILLSFCLFLFMGLSFFFIICRRVYSGLLFYFTLVVVQTYHFTPLLSSVIVSFLFSGSYGEVTYYLRFSSLESVPDPCSLDLIEFLVYDFVCFSYS